MTPALSIVRRCKVFEGKLFSPKITGDKSVSSSSFSFQKMRGSCAEIQEEGSEEQPLNTVVVCIIDLGGKLNGIYYVL